METRENARPEAVEGSTWRDSLFRVARDGRDRVRIAFYCRELRRLFLDVRAASPQLGREALYVDVVRQHLGVDEAYARTVVVTAAESYANWPTPRPVAFRDVAHYLVVARLSEGRGWLDLNVSHAVNCRIPTDW